MIDAIYAIILAMVGFAVVTLVGIGLMWAGFALVHNWRGSNGQESVRSR